MRQLLSKFEKDEGFALAQSEKWIILHCKGGHYRTGTMPEAKAYNAWEGFPNAQVFQLQERIPK